MKSSISKSTIFLFLLAGLAGLIVLYFYYDRAFPEASLELKLNGEQAIARSRDFLQGRGFVLSGYRSAAAFYEEREEIDFLERHLGLKKANTLFRTTVAVWRWKVRWFKELEEVEYGVEFTPDGRLVGFSRVFPDSVTGARLDEDHARRIAEAFLTGDMNLDLSRYEYIERTTENRPHRLDHELVWRYADFQSVGGSEYRVSVTLQGDRVAAFTQWLDIPQGWTLSQREIGARRDLLSRLSYLPVVILFLSILVVFFWRSHAGDIRWRWSLTAAGISAVVVFLSQINDFPLALLSYETTASLNAFWLGELATPLFTSILAFLFLVPLFGATDVAGRLYLAGRSGSSGVFSRSYLLSGDAFRQVLLGYGMAFAAAGYVTLFYVVGQRVLGVWSPVDVGFSNTFSTYFPSFSAIYEGFSAAAVEELVFRLFAVALLYRITKRFWPAVIIPALIWGFAHSTYPQEPLWIRGAELTIAGIVYGWVFLRYGLITTLVSHFTYNVLIEVIPQLQSGRVGLIANALFALALPLLTVGVARFVRPWVTGKSLPALRLLSASRFSGLSPGDDVEERLPVIMENSPSKGRAWWCIGLGVGVYSASFLAPYWDFYGPPPVVELTRQQAVALCDKVRIEIGFDSTGYRSYTEFSDREDTVPEYVISRFGIRAARERFKGLHGGQPQWVTRWYKEKTVQKLRIAVDEKGRLTGLETWLAETDPGARLSEGAAKDIAFAFLRRVLPEKGENWECADSDKTDHPRRIDYQFTCGDRSLKFGDLQRRLAVAVSGDKVTDFTPPWYAVPDEWSRDRELQQKAWRNTVREILSAFVAVALAVFFIVNVVILFRRRIAKREDAKLAVRRALALGAIPVALHFLNSLPAFYDGYFSHTEQSLLTYTLMELLGDIFRLIWMSVAVFLLFLMAPVILRAWMPEGWSFRSFIDRIRPGHWGTTENRLGVVLGIGLTLLGSGIDRLGDSCKAAFSPDLFSPSPGVTSIDLRHASEILTLVNGIPQTIIGCVAILLIVVIFRRFLNRSGKALVFIAVLSALTADSSSLSWSNLLVDWSVGLASYMILYYVVTRLIRWNPMAYLVWAWTELNWEAIADFIRFALSRSPEFFRPSVEQMAAFAAPLAIVLIVGLFRPGRSREESPLQG